MPDSSKNSDKHMGWIYGEQANQQNQSDINTDC
jgi:hypothetical protein